MENFIDITEKKLEYVFNNKDLLEQAFTRSSWAEENDYYFDNEVLEFIGDKVLDYIIVKRLLKRFVTMRKCPEWEKDENGEYIVKNIKRYCSTGEYNEGRLSKIKSCLVCCSSLASAIDLLGLAQYLRMSNGDIKNNVQNEPHVKEDLFEAIVGAVAIDSGWDIPTLDKLIDKMLDPDQKLDDGLNDEDYIGQLQKWYQSRNDGKLPEYQITESKEGFTASVNIHPELPEDFIRFNAMTVVFSGNGRSKKAACSEAARNAWQNIEDETSSRKTFYELVGDHNRERAINQLQELWQKGYIVKPEYVFTNEGSDENGKDIWLCECKIGDFPYFGVRKSSKLEAKKEVAYATTIELARVFNEYSLKGDK